MTGVDMSFEDTLQQLKEEEADIEREHAAGSAQLQAIQRKKKKAVLAAEDDWEKVDTSVLDFQRACETHAGLWARVDKLTPIRDEWYAKCKSLRNHSWINQAPECLGYLVTDCGVITGEEVSNHHLILTSSWPHPHLNIATVRGDGAAGGQPGDAARAGRRRGQSANRVRKIILPVHPASMLLRSRRICLSSILRGCRTSMSDLFLSCFGRKQYFAKARTVRATEKRLKQTNEEITGLIRQILELEERYQINSQREVRKCTPSTCVPLVDP